MEERQKERERERESESKTKIKDEKIRKNDEIGKKETSRESYLRNC